MGPEGEGIPELGWLGGVLPNKSMTGSCLEIDASLPGNSIQWRAKRALVRCCAEDQWRRRALGLPACRLAGQLGLPYRAGGTATPADRAPATRARADLGSPTRMHV